jgi:hypothetical protein
MTRSESTELSPRPRNEKRAPDELTRAELVSIIKDAGYALFELRRDWAECLIVRGRERWFGRGIDATDALRAALGEALPSALGWDLLQRARLPRSSEIAVETTEDAQEPLDAAGPAPTAGDTPPDVPEPEATSDAEPDAVRPAPPFERAAPPRHPPMSPAEALGALDELRTKVRLQLPEFAFWAPRRQRIYLLEAVGGGRALVDATGSDPEVSEHMHRLALYINEIAGSFWPGKVSALALYRYPLDCSKDLELKERFGPRTWLEVAEFAGSKLDELEVDDLDHERDEDGWADPPEQLPSAPKSLFNQVLSVVKDTAGPLTEKPRHARGGPRNTFAKARKPELLATARQLRWLRHARIDAVKWGQAMGHLRFLAESCPDDFPEFSCAVDSKYAPPASWADLLGVDPDKRAKQHTWRQLLQRFPKGAARTGKPANALPAWLLEALRTAATFGLSLERLATSLTQNRTPYLAAILATEPESLGGERSDRNRLRKLQAILSGADVHKTPELEPLDIPAEPKPRAIQPDHERMLKAILPHTLGKRALLITNRADTELEDTLKETFGFARLRLVESSLAKLASYKQSIARGTVDLVILATGFQSHAMEHAIKPAARAASIPYISAYRARRLDCMRAMMRDLGLEER